MLFIACDLFYARHTTRHEKTWKSLVGIEAMVLKRLIWVTRSSIFGTRQNITVPFHKKNCTKNFVVDNVTDLAPSTQSVIELIKSWIECITMDQTCAEAELVREVEEVWYSMYQSLIKLLNIKSRSLKEWVPTANIKRWSSAAICPIKSGSL